MKIRLYAFGDKLKSGIMDVPENTLPHFDLVLNNPTAVFVSDSGVAIAERPSFRARLTFEWTGQFEMADDWQTRIYKFTDIQKL